jgi:hypothetical protein
VSKTIDAVPESPASPVRAGGVCSPTAITVVTFICGPLAGALQMAVNELILARRRGWIVLLAGLAFCAAELWLLSYLPDGGTNFLLFAVICISLANAVALGACAYWVQRRAYKDHRARGGGGAGRGRLVGVSLLGWVLYFVAATACGPDLLEGEVVSGEMRVRFSSRVSEAEAARLSGVLAESKELKHLPMHKIRLDCSGKVYEVTLWVIGPFNERESDYSELARVLSTDAFDGNTVRIRVVDFLSQEQRGMFERMAP